jgi:hypothetical protein
VGRRGRCLRPNPSYSAPELRLQAQMRSVLTFIVGSTARFISDYLSGFSVTMPWVWNGITKRTRPARFESKCCRPASVTEVRLESSLRKVAMGVDVLYNLTCSHSKTAQPERMISIVPVSGRVFLLVAAFGCDWQKDSPRIRTRADD